MATPFREAPADASHVVLRVYRYYHGKGQRPMKPMSKPPADDDLRSAFLNLHRSRRARWLRLLQAHPDAFGADEILEAPAATPEANRPGKA